MTIAVIGAGAWGTALAAVFARNGETVRLCGRDAAVVEAIANRKENPRYLPGVELPHIAATTDMDRALDGAEIVLLVVPVKATAEVGSAILRRVGKAVPIVCCSKGIDPEAEETPTRILLRLNERASVGALSGPSFAADVARGLPTAVTLAAPELATARHLCDRLSGEALRLYANDDVVGVELGGALKNVMALAVGCARGLGLGASAEAAVIARGFDELGRIAMAVGARRETLNGLSGLGDLVLSCGSEKSRNFAFGMALGEGRGTDDLPLAEGVRTVATAAAIARRHGLDCAIVEGMERLLNGKVEARTLVAELLARPLRTEIASG